MSTKHILVVEDTSFIRNPLCARLQNDGYQVMAASSVSEALVTLRNSIPDLVILDLALTDDEDNSLCVLSDGFAFLSLLKRNYPDADTSTIIYTVSAAEDVQARAKAMGAFAVIDKKAGLQALITAVHAALEEREKRQAGSPAESA